MHLTDRDAKLGRNSVILTKLAGNHQITLDSRRKGKGT